MNAELHEYGINRRMGNHYTLEHDVNSYLAGSVIMNNGMPVVVKCDLKFEGDDEYQVIQLRDIVTNELYDEFPMGDTSFDIQSPELGYFNNKHSDGGFTKVDAFYSFRKPIKNWKQGLTFNNTGIVTIDGEAAVSSHVIFSQGFKEGLVNKFPSLQESLILLKNSDDKNKYSSVAISQDIALSTRSSGIILVYFRCEEVGFIDGQGVLNIPDKETIWIVEKYLSKYPWKINRMKK